MDTRRLNDTAFKATFTVPMREVSRGEPRDVDIWEYVGRLSPEDLDGLAPTGEDVHHVWRDAYDRYEHVLLPLSRSNVYLAVVVDLRNRSVFGHHVLDLGALYGQSDESPGCGNAPGDQADHS